MSLLPLFSTHVHELKLPTSLLGWALCSTNPLSLGSQRKSVVNCVDGTPPSPPPLPCAPLPSTPSLPFEMCIVDDMKLPDLSVLTYIVRAFSLA